jgi:uncharacterized membrane protein
MSTPRLQHRFRRSVLAPPSVPGALVGLACWWASLRPSLLPREWPMQAIVSGLCVAVGYGVGALFDAIGRAAASGGPGEPNRPWPASGATWKVLGVVGAAIVAVSMPIWLRTQDAQRALVDEDPTGALSAVFVVVASLALAVLFVGIGRLVGFAIHALDRTLARRLPRIAAHLITAAVFVVIGVVLSRDVVFDRFVSWANDRYAAFDDVTDPGVERPTSDLVSGSPASLAAWASLGEEGRDFVAGATTQEALRSFGGAGAEVVEPIRVYAGLQTAADADARAEVVVRELHRTGAADRDVVIVATATGTGWVDPVAIEAIELMHGGNTATASMQYSYLPSWISFLVDGPKAQEAGIALNRAVHAWWSDLPADDRPALVVFGESLGSKGTEFAYVGDDAAASVANSADRADGVLLVGPTNANPIWQQVIDARDAGSPVWRPVFDGGRTVRSMAVNSDADADDPAWTEPRVLYVHHASDPVGNWNMELLWSPPAWVDDPTGPDVPADVSWFPFVTWAQVVADLVAGFDATPGHGHDYSSNMAAAWAAVAPPDGWTADDTARLAAALGPSEESST